MSTLAKKAPPGGTAPGGGVGPGGTGTPAAAARPTAPGPPAPPAAASPPAQRRPVRRQQHRSQRRGRLRPRPRRRHHRLQPAGAWSTIIETGANVATLGGFSGRESEVSVSWLAGRVRAGKFRRVLMDGGGGGLGSDGRTGSTTVMAAVGRTCTPVNMSSSSGSTTTATSGLYDCAGKSDALASAAS